MHDHPTRARGRASSPQIAPPISNDAAPQGRPLGSSQNRIPKPAQKTWDALADELLQVRGLCTLRAAAEPIAKVYALQKTTRSILRSVYEKPLMGISKPTKDEARRLKWARRLSRCRWNRIAMNFHLVYAPDRHGSYFRGLETCGSVSACPNCSRIIQQRRRSELTPSVDRWTAGGGGVCLLTLTIPHDFTQPLAELMQAFGDASKSLWEGRARSDMAEAHGYAGRIKAWEVTRGQNGWHPHQHLLLFTKEKLSAEQMKALGTWFSERWTKAVVASGLLGKRPSAARIKGLREHGADLRDGADASAYVAKTMPLAERWGLADEMTQIQAKTGRKGSRSWIELVQDAQDGAPGAAMAWAEYADAFRGVRCLVWSPGLRELLGVGPELEDEDLADEGEAEAGEVVSEGYPAFLWSLVQKAEAKTGNKVSIRGHLLMDFAATKGDSSILTLRFYGLMAQYGTREEKELVGGYLKTLLELKPEPRARSTRRAEGRRP